MIVGVRHEAPIVQRQGGNAQAQKLGEKEPAWSTERIIYSEIQFGNGEATNRNRWKCEPEFLWRC